MAEEDNDKNKKDSSMSLLTKELGKQTKAMQDSSKSIKQLVKLSTDLNKSFANLAKLQNTSSGKLVSEIGKMGGKTSGPNVSKDIKSIVGVVRDLDKKISMSNKSLAAIERGIIKLSKVESSKERDRKRGKGPFEKLGKQFKDVANKLNPANLASAFSKSLSNLMPKMPSGGGIGIGGKAGLVMGGLGLLLMGGTQLLETIEKMNAKKIRENVVTLMGMADDVDKSNWQVLGEGAAFGLALTGIGAGLTIFAVGGAAAAGVEKFTEGQDWPKTIKERVTTLLSIADNKNFGALSLLGEGLTFGTAMAAIGAGLAFFAIGGAAAAGVEKFTEGQDWPTVIKERVTTLLSIADDKMFGGLSLLGEGLTFGTAMAAIGAGLAIFAIGGAAAAGVSKFTESEDWATSIKDKVVTLLSIKDELGGNWAMLKSGGAFVLSMTGLGLGLSSFSLGSGLAASVDYLKKKGWAKRIKENVVTLLSIKDELGGNWSMLKGSGAFVVSMTGLSAGLGAFSLGSGLAASVDYLKKKDWAVNIKDNVVTLLSIKDELGGNWAMLKSGGAFALAMAGIGAGLTAFSLGEASVGLAEWTTKDDWALQIVANVKTLLGIADLDNLSVESVTVVGSTLGALGLALAAFGIGGTIVGISESVNKFAGNDDFAKKIKNQVQTLVEIPDLLGENPTSKATELKTVLKTISEGISSFSPGIGDTLSSFGEAIAGFFGAKSPFDKIIGISDKSDKLSKSAAALTEINETFEKLGSQETSKTDTFVSNMDKISAAVKNFGGEEGFWSKLGDSISSFFTKDPLKPFLTLSDKGDNLFRAGVGMEKITKALQETGSFGNDGDRSKGLHTIIDFAKEMKTEQDTLDKVATTLRSIASSVVSINEIASPTGAIVNVGNENVNVTGNLAMQQASLDNVKESQRNGGGNSSIVSAPTDNSSTVVNNTNVTTGGSTPTTDYTDWKSTMNPVYR